MPELPVDEVEFEFIHVFPLFGPKHEHSVECWCHPEPDWDVPIVILHNVIH